jgi:hypothetical protein
MGNESSLPQTGGNLSDPSAVNKATGDPSATVAPAEAPAEAPAVAPAEAPAEAIAGNNSKTKNAGKNSSAEQVPTKETTESTKNASTGEGGNEATAQGGDNATATAANEATATAANEATATAANEATAEVPNEATNEGKNNSGNGANGDNEPVNEDLEKKKQECQEIVSPKPDVQKIEEAPGFFSWLGNWFSYEKWEDTEQEKKKQECAILLKRDKDADGNARGNAEGNAENAEAIAKNAGNKEETKITQANVPAVDPPQGGGRRYTHKNRDSNRRTRKNREA